MQITVNVETWQLQLNINRYTNGQITSFVIHFIYIINWDKLVVEKQINIALKSLGVTFAVTAIWHMLYPISEDHTKASHLNSPVWKKYIFTSKNIATLGKYDQRRLNIFLHG